MFGYEKLEVYQCSIKFVTIAYKIIEDLPRGYSDLADQLKRCSMSIPLNIAESSGKNQRQDAARFFAIARGSAMESGAAIDVGLALDVVDQSLADQAKKLLVRIVAMLTKLCRI